MPIDLRDQYFGTEIEMTGITRQRAAQVVAEMFGTDYYHRISFAIAAFEVLMPVPCPSLTENPALTMFSPPPKEPPMLIILFSSGR